MTAFTSIISSGKAFNNPYSSIILNIKSIMNTSGLKNSSSPFYIQAQIDALLAKPLTTFTPSKVSDIANSFQNIEEKLDDLLSHTDNLSGVNLAGDMGLGNMAQIMTVARAVSGESSCSEFNKAFGAIMQSAAIIAAITSLIDKIIEFLEDPEAIADELLNKLSSIANQIVDQIQADLEAFARGQALAIANALSSAIAGLISDPCFSGVLETIMTDEMKKKVEEFDIPELPRITL